VCPLSSVPEPDVLRRVVIRVHFCTRTSGTQSVLLAVVRVRKPTVCPRTTLGRVVRLDLFHGDTLFRGFVRDILKQASERPDVVPFSLRKPSRMSFKSSNAITSQSCSMASRDEFVCDRGCTVSAMLLHASRGEAEPCVRLASHSVASHHASSRTHDTSGRSRLPCQNVPVEDTARLLTPRSIPRTV